MTAFAEIRPISAAVFVLSFCFLVLSVPVHQPVATVDSHVEEKFSAAPNNTPISKVYIFGRPVYIREPFVIPQRNYSEPIDFSKLFDESTKQRTNRASQQQDDPARAQAARTRTGYKGPRGNYDIGRENRPDGYATKDGYKEDAYADQYPWTGKYPLRQCYTETSGYMCCNLHLEKVIHNTTQKMKESKSCNLQKMSTMLADITEDIFGTDFEAIAAVGDFASKIHFYSDYVCKMKRDGRTILVYATPSRHNYTVDNYSNGKYSITPYTL